MMLPIARAGTLVEVRGPTMRARGRRHRRARDHDPDSDARSLPCPTATATSDSCSHAARRPPRSRLRCGKGRVASIWSSREGAPRLDLRARPSAGSRWRDRRDASGRGATRCGALDLSIDPWDPDARGLGRQGRALGARCTPRRAWPARSRRPSTGPGRLLRALRRDVQTTWRPRSSSRDPDADLAALDRGRPDARRTTSPGPATCSHRSSVTPTWSRTARSTWSRRSRHRAGARTGAVTARCRSSTTVASASTTSTRSWPMSRNRSRQARATSPTATRTSSTASTTRCRVVRAVHARFPDLTFDCTVKVEHILRHADVWAELAASGCIFVVSAFESVNDATLELLDKGHTAAEAGRAVALLRAHGIEIRPSWLPFTPWATLDDVRAILEFVAGTSSSGTSIRCSTRSACSSPRARCCSGTSTDLGPWDEQRLTYVVDLAARPAPGALRGARRGRRRRADPGHLRRAARRGRARAARAHRPVAERPGSTSPGSAAPSPPSSSSAP